MSDFITETYGADVAAAMRGAASVVELAVKRKRA